jgi:hypothetical protein
VGKAERARKTRVEQIEGDLRFSSGLRIPCARRDGWRVGDRGSRAGDIQHRRGGAGPGKRASGVVGSQFVDFRY